MARFDRGGLIWPETALFWARQHHRTYLIIRQIVGIRQIVSLTGKLSAENDP
jgi:hypothetical protein